ncbi:hypothetical protein LTR53_010784 [Teratosphaeriaceae sp. CCFEE 6253]|nr:hypothetical protein LTR53_010784 [Teratosphaeriaceae sp. CCFEE 6253]
MHPSTPWLLLAFGGTAIAHPLFHPKITWVDCHNNVPSVLSQGFPTDNFSAAALPSTLHCGQIQVPVDYSKSIHADGNQITVGLAMYRPRKPKGVLFYCPGGTDAGAVIPWQVALGLNSDFTPDFAGLLDYDLMAMDIRGTWSSNVLNVSLDTVLPLVSVGYPANRWDFDAYLAAATTMWQSWANLSSPAGILDHMGTPEVVQDYDSIRSALGHDKIHFLGASTGSFRASQYASTYPNRVGHFALNAVVPHGLSVENQVKYDILAVNRGLLRADAFCQNNATCPWHHAGRGSVPNVRCRDRPPSHSQRLTFAWETYRDLLASATNGTLVACDTPTATDCSGNGTAVPAWELQAAIARRPAGQPDFPMLLDALALARAGNAAALVASPPPTLDQFWGFPLICNDYPVDKSFRAYQKVIKTAASVDTHRLNQSMWIFAQLICSAWPYAVPVDEPLGLNATMLLVTSDFDVSQPTEKTTFMWETQTPHSALVVRHGDDHVSFNEPKVASTEITKQFLRTGVLPLDQDSTYVTVYQPGEHRRPVADPYCAPTGFWVGDIDSAPDIA